MTRVHASMLARWTQYLYLNGYRYSEALNKAKERAEELELLERHNEHARRYP